MQSVTKGAIEIYFLTLLPYNTSPREFVILFLTRFRRATKMFLLSSTSKQLRWWFKNTTHSLFVVSENKQIVRQINLGGLNLNRLHIVHLTRKTTAPFAATAKTPTTTPFSKPENVYWKLSIKYNCVSLVNIENGILFNSVLIKVLAFL